MGFVCGLNLFWIFLYVKEDSRLAYWPKSSDTACGAIMFIVFVFFFADLLLNSISRFVVWLWLVLCRTDEYFLGFYFWMDLFSTIAMIPDVCRQFYFLYILRFRLFGPRLLIFLVLILFPRTPNSSRYFVQVFWFYILIYWLITGRIGRIGSRVGRLVRVFRLVRLLRVLSLLQTFLKKVQSEKKHVRIY